MKSKYFPYYEKENVVLKKYESGKACAFGFYWERAERGKEHRASGSGSGKSETHGVTCYPSMIVGSSNVWGYGRGIYGAGWDERGGESSSKSTKKGKNAVCHN